MIYLIADFFLKQALIMDISFDLAIIIVWCLIIFRIMFSTCLQKWFGNNRRCTENHQAEPPANPVDRSVNVWVNSSSFDCSVNIFVRGRLKLSSVMS